MGLATSQDVSDYDPTLTLPARIDRYLRAAEGLVVDAIRLSVYKADPVTGLPSSAANLAALKEAVCAQVAAWVDAGADPTGAGDQAAAAAVVSSKSLSPVGSVSFDTQAQREANTVRAASTRYLCPEAQAVLMRAGLSRVVVTG
jgi:hypothetical protein